MIGRLNIRLCLTALVIMHVALSGSGCTRTPLQKEAAFLTKGKELMKKGDYARAILEFRNAIGSRPDDAEAYYQLALAQLAAGETGPGATSLMKATELDPKHAAAQMKSAELLSGDNEKASLIEAEKRIRVVLAASPNNPDALNILAIVDWGLGKQQEAEESLNQAFAQFPANLKSTVSLARLKLANKDTQGAEQILRKAVSSDPHSADFHIAFGNFYVAVDKPAQAEEQFQLALQIDPRRGPALVALANLKMRARQMEQADQLYQKASALPDPNLKPLHAIFLFQTGKRDLAISELEKLVRQNPADRSMRSRLVGAYEAANRIPDAEKVLASALQKNAKDTDALLQRSELEVRAGRYLEAQADLAKILRFSPDSAVAHFLMGRVYQRRGATLSQRQEWSESLRLDPKFLVVRLQLARLLISSNSAQAALNMLNEAPPEQKNSTAVLLQKNWAHLTLGELPEAKKGINQALSSAKTPEALWQDAAMKFAQHDSAGARKSLEEALKQNPEDAEALNLLVQIYESQKQMLMALDKVREYLAQKPNSAVLHQVFGELLAKTGDRAKARKEFIAAKAASSSFVKADLSLAKLDVDEGKLQDARNTLSATLTSNPQDVTTRLLLASVELQAADFAGATEQYRKVLEINDQNVVALNNLAFILAEYEKHPDEALPLAQKAKELDPDSPLVQDTLGWVLYRKGLYSSAIPYLEQAVSKEPTARRKCHLALAYLKSGDQRGRQILSAATAMSPELLKERFLQEFLSDSTPVRR